ncbi:hypothetical protein JMJ35_000052 [Cladonia borealis]|uniref:Uncharacterized protein n=1 Tax=Cladonia borealis TaxID=184061 RepID=A0AA39V5H2_9LECA|nr:hypothetical protein JMJ35_000052 [Cladonia borealis]
MERCADPALRLEVDEFILDYLVHMALKGILKDYKRAQSGARNVKSQGAADITLHMVNVTSETTPSKTALQRLSDQRHNQAIAFRSMQQSLASLPLVDLNEYHAPQFRAPIKQQQSSRSPTPPGLSQSHVTSTPPSTSLLDSLPSFMALSAVFQTTTNQTTITDTWMRLAAGFMAQAVIEQYLIYGSTGDEVLQEAFAWGFDAECTAEEGSDEWEINAMFWGEDQVVPRWEEIRDAHMQALVPPAGTDLLTHLRGLIDNELSVPKFEECMIAFLDGLLRDQSIPVLAQVEMGQVDGVSREEARVLQQAIGIV